MRLNVAMTEPSHEAALDFAPDWPTCQEEVSPGCIGIRVDGFDRCFAHLQADALSEALAHIHAGPSLDARGTTFENSLFRRVLGAAMSRGRHFGSINLFGAQFTSRVHIPSRTNFGDRISFAYSRFQKGADFQDVHFHGYARFDNAHFCEDVNFYRTEFSDGADFADAHFHKVANFGIVKLGASVGFLRTKFNGPSSFDGTKFKGEAYFGQAEFATDASFNGGTHFHELSSFSNAIFAGVVEFSGAHFHKTVSLKEATFNEAAMFIDTNFDGEALFGSSNFHKFAGFGGANFHQEADFREVKFGAGTYFGSKFDKKVNFSGAKFENSTLVGPLVAKEVILSDSEFSRPVEIAVETSYLSCDRTRFECDAKLRVRCATISLRQASFGGPSSIEGRSQVSEIRSPSSRIEASTEEVEGWNRRAAYCRSTASNQGSNRNRIEEWIPGLVSLEGTDVGELLITDVDLRWCRFAGAHNLDKLRIEGRSLFHAPPSGWRGWYIGRSWPFVWRWTDRLVIAEEHAWRRQQTDARADTWEPHPEKEVGQSVGADRLAVLYRSLRKALEDGKNEAGAGDFYYGEMEARRHAGGLRDKFVLGAYWLLSGYGQRALRAVTCLAALVALLTVLLLGWGLPTSTAPQQATGTLSAPPVGAEQTLKLQVSDAQVSLPPPEQRWTADRAGKAVQLAFGSVVFRDAAQKLTPAGTWTITAGRFFGPILLALAVLAVRARVKR